MYARYVCICVPMPEWHCVCSYLLYVVALFWHVVMSWLVTESRTKDKGLKILILTGAAFSLKATLPGDQWLCTHIHTHTIRKSVRQLGSVVGKGGVTFFPTALEVIPGHLSLPLLCNHCFWPPDHHGLPNRQQVCSSSLGGSPMCF